MKLKTIFLGLLIIQTALYIIWLFGYMGVGEMPKLEAQTYSIMTNIKLLLVVAWYIAWRVTPDSK